MSSQDQIKSNQNESKKSESTLTLHHLLTYLQTNVSSAYPKADEVLQFIDSKVDSFMNDEDDNDYKHVNVKDNESLVKLLVGFLAHPSEDQYHLMRSKLSKAKKIDFKNLFVSKREGKAVDVVLSHKLSVNEVLDISSQSYQTDFYPEMSKIQDSGDHSVKLYVEREPATTEYLNLYSCPHEFVRSFKVPLGRDEDTETPLYIELEDFLSSFDKVLDSADSRELSVSFHYTDLQSLVYYLPSTNGKVSPSVYASTDLSYKKRDDSQHCKKFILLSDLYSKVNEMSDTENPFVKIHDFVKELRSSFQGKDGDFVNLDHLPEELSKSSEYKKEQSHVDREKKKRNRRVKATREYLDFDEEDNYWNLDLTSKAVRNKIDRVQEGRNWKDAWSESLLNSMNDESGSSNEYDLDILSIETLQKILNGDIVTKYEFVPFREFHKRLDLLVRDLNEKNIDHFARNCRKLLKLLVELDNRDLVMKVTLMKEHKYKEFTIKLARMENDIVKNLQYLCDSGNNDDINDRLQSIIKSLIISSNKRLSNI